MAAIPLHHGIQQAERTLTLSRLIQKKRTRNLIMFCSVVLSYISLHNNRLNSDIYRVHLSLVTDGGTGTSVLQFAFPMKRIRISGYGAM